MILGTILLGIGQDLGASDGTGTPDGMVDGIQVGTATIGVGTVDGMEIGMADGIIPLDTTDMAEPQVVDTQLRQEDMIADVLHRQDTVVDAHRVADMITTVRQQLHQEDIAVDAPLLRLEKAELTTLHPEGTAVDAPLLRLEKAELTVLHLEDTVADALLLRLGKTELVILHLEDTAVDVLL